MIQVLYEFFYLFGFVFYIPKFLGMCFLKKKYKNNFFQRFKRHEPLSFNDSIWIHAVSLGEVRASIPLIHQIKKQVPFKKVILSTITEAGFEEAKKIAELEDFFYLPFDFFHLTSRLVKAKKPSVVIFIEGDLWPNFIFALKKEKIPFGIVSGKISKRSFNRYGYFPYLKEKFFSSFSFIFVQNAHYYESFKKLGIDLNKLKITGNLKFDLQPPVLSEKEIKELKEKLNLKKSDFVIVLASTHKFEEELLLLELREWVSKNKNIKVLLVPRHSYRFSEVRQSLTKCGFEFSVFSEIKQGASSQIILIDAVGFLNNFYQISNVAVVCGSFTPVGGHNILEPLFFNKPLLFGPYMETQKELCDLVKKEGVGIEVTDKSLKMHLQKIYLNQELPKGSDNFLGSLLGSSLKTFSEISPFIK
jgi:3-deoxy-D-manno-octulosonic-acid transferase